VIVLYFGAIKNCDIANGPGVRVSIFVSGCTNGCHNCFQPETWDFQYGSPFDKAAQDHIIDLLRPAFIKGLTVLGGEPFEPANQRALYPFIERVRQTYPEKSIWMYSGNRLEEILGSCGDTIEDGDLRKARPGYIHTEVSDDLLALIDVLVDGRFVERLKDISLDFRGSSNQRLIDMPKTLKQGHVVLWENVTSKRPDLPHGVNSPRGIDPAGN
jgi:anaerobic ribonucleoside-triphosphate reductase activating protein